MPPFRAAHRRLLALCLLTARLLTARLLIGGLLIGGLLLPPLAAAADAAPTRWGTHGMVVFGNREGLYAMHLAMFHRPHDVQAVIRFHLADAAADAQLRQTLAAHPVLWTLDPQKFDLDRLAPGAADPLDSFPAQLYAGHFERDGRPMLPPQQVVVDSVLQFHALDLRYQSRSEARYWLIGSGTHRFLLKVLDRRPDADLLLAVDVPAATPVMLQRVHSIAQTPADPLQWSRWLSSGSRAPWRVTATIYADDADLR